MPGTSRVEKKGGGRKKRKRRKELLSTFSFLLSPLLPLLFACQKTETAYMCWVGGGWRGRREEKSLL